MDLPCVKWRSHVEGRWKGLHLAQQETFASLIEVDDAFSFALQQVSQQDLDCMQSMSAGCTVKKNRDQAVKCRERGNSSFKDANYRAAVLHYSQGVCCAPSNSEQLSLCFANRSAALYRLERYQECLADIERALKAGYPCDLSHKLKDRQALCLDLLRKKTSENSGVTSLLGRIKVPSVGIPNFGICPEVVVSYSLKKGRHLVAKEKIAPGSVILTDRPYSCVLIPATEEPEGKDSAKERLFGTQHLRCHRCLAETLCSVPCESCSYSRYCSASCRQEAWKEHHRWECPLAADLMALGVMTQLALRIALKAKLKTILDARQLANQQHKESVSNRHVSNQPDLFSTHYGDSYFSVFHLLHHWDYQSTALRFLCSVTAATLYTRLCQEQQLPIINDFTNLSTADQHATHGPQNSKESGSNQWLLGSAILRHLLQLRCNAQAIITLQDKGEENSRVQSQQEIRIATAMFPSLSLLNHSCCPNTSMVFCTGSGSDPCGVSQPANNTEQVHSGQHEDRGVTVTVRAAKEIKPGQEILHCYGPHRSRMMTEKRQRLLQEQYFFLCECEACRGQEDAGDAGAQQQPQQSSVIQRPAETHLLCLKCKAALCNNSKDGFICSRSVCGHGMSSADVNSKLHGIKVFLEKAVELMEREMPAEALQMLNRSESLSERLLSHTHPLQGELADTTARAYAIMGEWKKAASYLEQSTAAIISQYGGKSIELGQQLFKLAQLHFNSGAKGPALAVISKARQLLVLHRGLHCSELLELQAMEDCLQE